MVDFSAVFPVIGSAFIDWLKLFAAPLKNLDMLWIIIPIWGVWLFSEFFQEKKGTSFGNAISNGAVMLFVGVDWIRYVVRNISQGNASLDAASITETAISVVIIAVSLAIIVLGIRGRKVVKLIGRVRESTYLLLMFTPVIYGVVEFNFRTVAVILAFFPLFYLAVELLDRLLPTPKTYELEEEEMEEKGLGLGKTSGFGAGGLSSDFGQDVFGQQTVIPQQPAQQFQPRQNLFSEKGLSKNELQQQRQQRLF